MIAKMKFINMIGPKEDLEVVVEKYLSKYEIQLENTMAELKDLQNVSPCTEANPYKDSLAKAEELVAMTKHENPLKKTVGAKQAIEIVESLEEKRERFRRKRGELEEKKQQIAKALQDIEPYRNVNHDIRDILHFESKSYCIFVFKTCIIDSLTLGSFGSLLWSVSLIGLNITIFKTRACTL